MVMMLLYVFIKLLFHANVLLSFFFFFLLIGLLAVGYRKFGDEEALIADPIRHLFDVYVKINVCNFDSYIDNICSL